MQPSAQMEAPLLEFSGTLVHAAEARMRMLDGQLSVPVLCMDIELDNSIRSLMHVEQPSLPTTSSKPKRLPTDSRRACG